MFISLFISLSLFGQSYQRIGNPDLCKSRLEKKTKATKSISGEFKETVHSSLFNEPQYGKGKIFYQSENKIRWEHTSPKKQVVLISSQGMRIAENGVESKSSGSQTIMKKVKALMMQLLNGDFLNEKDFKITYYESSDKYKLVLKPKSSRMARYISSVVMVFNKKSLRLNKMILKENEDERIEYSFVNLKFNQPINSSTFTKF